MDKEVKYDALITAIINRILIENQNSDNLILTNIDPTNKAHLCMLEIINLCKFFCTKKIMIDADCIGPIKYWYYKYELEHLPRTHEAVIAGVIDVDKLINDIIYDYNLVSDTCFCNIYDIYYKPLTRTEVISMKIKNFFNSIKETIKNGKI